MKKAKIFLLVLCLALSGCGQAESIKEKTVIPDSREENSERQEAETDQEIREYGREENSRRMPDKSRTQEIVWREALYEDHLAELEDIDSLRNKAFIFGEDGWDWRGEDYLAYVDTSELNPIFHESGKCERIGLLAAQTGGEGVTAMRAAVHDAYGWLEYEYFNTGRVIYFSICGQERGEDIPYYWLNPDSLDFDRVEEEWQTEDIEYLRSLPVLKEESIKKEYLVINKRLYVLGREEEKLADITETSMNYSAEWLEQTAQRVFLESKITPEAVETVRSIASGPYTWSDTNSKLAVCDLNKDGTDDYVVNLVDPESIYVMEKIVGWSEVIYLYLSDEEGGYQERALEDENWWKTRDLFFKSDGMLCRRVAVDTERYYPVRSTWFQFDGETEEFFFCLESEYYDDPVVPYLRIRGTEEGAQTLRKYYKNRKYYWSNYYGVESKENIYRTVTENGQKLRIIYNSILANPEQGFLDDALLEMLRCAKIFANGIFIDQKADYSEKEVYVCVEYQNPELVSGHFRTVDENGKFRNKRFMIDRKSAKAVYVQELISRDEMLSIFGRGTKESWGDRVKEEDKGKYLFLLGWGYENANSLKAEGTQEDVGVSVDFEMSEWGLKAYIQINAESGETEQEILYLDKEFLIDTSLWEYWKYNKN